MILAILLLIAAFPSAASAQSVTTITGAGATFPYPIYAKWAEAYGQDTSALKQLAEELWAGGGGLDIEVLGKSDRHVDFNVTRCRYAEFYQELGLAELGYQLQCSRDHAMLAGFNPAMELSRTQTLMEGGSCCDFRFRQKTAIT